MTYAEEIAVAFTMHCDGQKLTQQAGERLAEEVADALVAAADDRRAYAPYEDD